MHSSVLFKSKHNDVSWFYGRFNELSGTIVYDPADVSKSKVTMEVAAESVDTRNEKLDQHLKSPDFFDAVQFPVIAFESTKVASAGEGRLAVTGDLVLHGVMKEVTVELEHVGSADGRRGKLVGFHGVFTIDRTEFGMTYGADGGLGKEVELTVSVEAGAR